MPNAFANDHSAYEYKVQDIVYRLGCLDCQEFRLGSKQNINILL